MNKRTQTLVLLLAGGAGFLAGTQVSDSDLNLGDNDRVLIYRGDTAVVHAMDLRKTRSTLSDGGTATTANLTIYGAVQDNDGGVHDLGQASCALNDTEQARLLALMNANVARGCARGDAGGALVAWDVHAVDLRRYTTPVIESYPDGGQYTDGGVEVRVSMLAYGTRPQVDGGTLWAPGQNCSTPDAGAALFDRIGMACFRKAKGLGK